MKVSEKECTILQTEALRVTSKHANAFQCLEECGVAIQCWMLNTEEGLQSSYACQHRDINELHTVVLDLAPKHGRQMGLFERLAVIHYPINAVHVTKNFMKTLVGYLLPENVRHCV